MERVFLTSKILMLPTAHYRVAWRVLCSMLLFSSSHKGARTIVSRFCQDLLSRYTLIFIGFGLSHVMFHDATIQSSTVEWCNLTNFGRFSSFEFRNSNDEFRASNVPVCLGIV